MWLCVLSTVLRRPIWQMRVCFGTIAPSWVCASGDKYPPGADVSGSSQGGDEGSGGSGAAHVVPVSLPGIDPPRSYLAPAKTHSPVLTGVYYAFVFFFYFFIFSPWWGLLAGRICQNAGETSVFIKGKGIPAPQPPQPGEYWRAVRQGRQGAAGLKSTRWFTGRGGWRESIMKKGATQEALLHWRCWNTTWLKEHVASRWFFTLWVLFWRCLSSFTFVLHEPQPRPIIGHHFCNTVHQSKFVKSQRFQEIYLTTTTPLSEFTVYTPSCHNLNTLQHKFHF